MRVATAKIRTFSFIFQIFPEVFFILFLLTASLSIADAKVGGFYLLTKCFCNYFLKYFSVFCFLLVSNDLVVGVFSQECPLLLAWPKSNQKLKAYAAGLLRSLRSLCAPKAVRSAHFDGAPDALSILSVLRPPANAGFSFLFFPSLPFPSLFFLSSFSPASASLSLPSSLPPLSRVIGGLPQ